MKFTIIIVIEIMIIITIIIILIIINVIIVIIMFDTFAYFVTTIILRAGFAADFNSFYRTNRF